MNPYYDHFEITTLKTTIQEEKDGYYAFKDTIFFGEKGGMPSDEGKINGLKVLDLKYIDDVLYHRVDGKLENPILMEVDPIIRFTNTAIQSTFHLLDGFFKQKGYQGGSIGCHYDNLWYEVNIPNISKELCQEVESFIQQVIREDLPVQITYISGKDYDDPHYQQFDQVRIVNIGNKDIQPCGTLHIQHTGQIGSFTILRSEKCSRGSRLICTIHQTTEQKLHQTYDALYTIANCTGQKMEDTAQYVEDLMKSYKEQKEQIKQLKKQLLTNQVESLLKQDLPYYTCVIETQSDFQGICQLMLPMIQGTKFVIAPLEQDTFIGVISNENLARTKFDELKQTFTIQGGGSPKIATGKIANTSLQEVLKTIEH